MIDFITEDNKGTWQYEQRAKALSEWLSKLPDMQEVSPILVTLHGKTYYGARYVQVMRYTASMMCVLQGFHKPGDTYTQEALYLLGPPPHKIKGRAKFCFEYEKEEWFVSGYFTGDLKKFGKMHPFGHYFSLRPWRTTDGHSIDWGEPRPYVRAAMTLTPIS